MAAAKESPAHAADRFLAVEGARLRFRDEGSGPALVLLHGWTLDLQMWDAQSAALADQFRLVRFDRRGHGLSSGPPAPDGDASDVAALCGHLQLGEVGVVGMSQGARAALAFAQASPQRVRALLLDGPPTLTSGVVDDDVPLAQFRALVRRHGLAGFRSAWMRHPLTQLRTPDPEVRQRLAAMVDRFAGYELSTPAPAAPRAEQLRPGAIAAPVLIVNGASDLPSRLAYAEHLVVQLPLARRALIEGAGHLPNLDRPVEYNQLCRDFFLQHMRAPRAP